MNKMRKNELVLGFLMGRGLGFLIKMYVVVCWIISVCVASCFHWLFGVWCKAYRYIDRQIDRQVGR